MERTCFSLNKLIQPEKKVLNFMVGLILAGQMKLESSGFQAHIYVQSTPTHFLGFPMAW